jgi:predicted enzyme related to lactoylglutathione lyase
MEFYTNVFGWTFKKSEAGDGMAYNEFSTSAGYPSGGLYNIDPKWFGDDPPPPHFMTYIAVDDVDMVTQRAGELGAAILREPMDIPGVGRMSVIKDPTGAVFATFKPKM